MELKGISLSIETIIILIVCVLVLVVSILFFTDVYNRGAEVTLEQQKLSAECLKWDRHSHDHALLENYPTLNEVFDGDPIKAEEYCIQQKDNN
ncbi:MAG: hypothetical protein KAU95_02545 [Candidatus Aenigmarchaeota archaeon]|nr:hypothetical protein [Candidatus Aenigmarchaeota archaeon]